METEIQERASTNLGRIADVLKAEKAEIQRLRKLRKLDGPADAPTVGLAFSGGGIRSATINLGILQALAKYKLLKRIDYLSTVSGGGYIGSWLTRWIHECGIDHVQEKLGETTKEADQITFLREYSNYMTPKLGLFGADTWAAIATYLRNVLLNQAILVAFLSAVLCLPWILGVAFGKARFSLEVLTNGGVAAVLIIFAVAMGVVNTSTCAGSSVRATMKWTSQRNVLLLVVLPLFAGAFFLNYAIWSNTSVWTSRVCFWGGLIVYTAGHLVGWLASKWKFGTDPNAVPSIQNVLWALPCGALAGFEVHILKMLALKWGEDAARGYWNAVSWGPPLFVLSFLLIGGLHIGVAKFALRNEIYEWWSRLGGWLLLWGVFWAVLFGLTIFVPWFVHLLTAYTSRFASGLKWTAVAGWIVHSALGAKLGWSSNTNGKPSHQTIKEIVAKAAPFVFVGGLLILLATCVHDLGLIAGKDYLGKSTDWWVRIGDVPLKTFALLAAVFGALAVFLSWRIDINRFSMNMLYKNRLVRCYLGASNEARDGQQFTGFDPADDIKLTCFTDPQERTPEEAKVCEIDSKSERTYDGPYPILNATLNVTRGTRLAWQERKAESFIFTPMYCGFDYPELHHKTNEKLAMAKGAESSGYHRTKDWAMPNLGVTLGTAVAISGAAVSPNMGFHTYPPLAFLMTVFDVRLGVWFANPRFENDQVVAPVSDLIAGLKKLKGAAAKWLSAALQKMMSTPEGGPRTSLLYLLCELFGTTTDTAKFVYLTDGAHFENLALYELIRRECDFIIASDAGEDSQCTFSDLSNAIRKCRTDLGAEVILNLAPVTTDLETGSAKAHSVLGEIHYRSGKIGQILYFKSCLTGAEPNDVKDYRRLHPEFPQQSTADQWFDESQFESYRELGLFAANSGLSRAAHPNSAGPAINNVFDPAPIE